MTGASSKALENFAVSMVAEVMITRRSRRRRIRVLQVAQDEIDVEAALVGLVHDERVVGGEHPVAGRLGQQDAVGHDLDVGLRRGGVLEADLVAHGLPDALPQFLGDAPGHRLGRDPPGLGVADQPVDARGRPPGRTWGSGWICPEPVSPETTTTGCRRMAAMISSFLAVMGRLSGKASAGRSCWRRALAATEFDRRASSRSSSPSWRERRRHAAAWKGCGVSLPGLVQGLWKQGFDSTYS